MLESLDPTNIIACAIRPAGSFVHLVAMVGFVFAAWGLRPKGERA